MLMQNGSTTYLEVLTAQQTLLEARIGEVSNTLSEISSTITLYTALGGGVSCNRNLLTRCLTRQTRFRPSGDSRKRFTDFTNVFILQ